MGRNRLPLPAYCHGVEASDLQQELQRLREALEVANRTAADIVASQTGVEALERLAEAARLSLGARYAAVGVASDSGDGLDEFVTVGLTQDEERAIGPRPRGAGVLGLLLTRTTPLRLEDLNTHPAAAGVPPNHPPMKSFLGVPILHGNRVLGSLYLTEKPGGFTETDEVTVQALSAFLAVAIRNLQLLKRQRSLLAGLMAAQEDERRALAYDLHDGLTQYVMAAHAQLETFQANRNEARLEAGVKYLKEAVIESRRLINGLRTLALDDLGLPGAVEQLLREEQARNGWTEANLTNNGVTGRLPLPMETALLRIAQEAIANIRKHARAHRVWVSLAREADALIMSIADDGIGFDPSEAPPAGRAYRASWHGGACPTVKWHSSSRKRAQPGNDYFRVDSSATGTKRAIPMNEISVVLVDDHAIWREGVKGMLEDTVFQVVGEASNGKEALEVVASTNPRLVLLDIRMAGGDGLEALEKLKANHPQTSVVMLTTYDNPTYMARAVAGGAAGYVLKGVSRGELLDTLEKVASGESLLSAQELVRSLRAVSDRAATVDLISPLTTREEEVLRLLATGLSNKEIAGVLYIAEATVKTHVEHIIGKLGVSDRVQAAVWAARQGIVTEKDLPELSVR
ncbi:MAG: response regulator [Armatimonas sp.]